MSLKTWEQRKFSKLLDVSDGVRRGPFGSALKKSYFVKDSPYVVYEQQNAIYNRYSTRYHITQEKYDELSKFKLLPGDFIMSGAGTIGRISEVPLGIQKGVFNQALIRFRINPAIVDRRYFLMFMRGEIMQRHLTEANPGSAITNLVPMKDVKNYIVSISNLAEQKKIGKIIENVDSLIAANEQVPKLVIKIVNNSLANSSFSN
ncbi:restriction endonuclease subunit S [Lactiplantibacillus argentoratensis]|uniref:restriction endonuclease subunit S n=1 Tax=Lactiplantibacillus argentoratensis TaxID=271881 RepID=UPI00298BFAD1|nr:restriction endonuclease subunit S [Lactiplantibacillus argentoratensis]